MNFSKNSGKKKATVAAVVCFAAAIAITGTYTFNNYKESKAENNLAMTDTMDETFDKAADTAVDGEIVGNEMSTDDTDIQEESVVQEIDTNKDLNLDVTTSMDDVTQDISESVSRQNAASVNFSDESLVLWPVAGTVLMDYSMDQTIYFKTLDQYKYNPALVIAAAENDSVIAGASGLVKSIDESAQTGTTVNIDLGNGYEAFYGQLQNIAVKTGDYVDATTTLGYVAEPTKYYTSEGTNVYFEMRKDGQPVNPKDYMTDYAE